MSVCRESASDCVKIFMWIIEILLAGKLSKVPVHTIKAYMG